jgi:hypothetical protein
MKRAEPRDGTSGFRWCVAAWVCIACAPVGPAWAEDRSIATSAADDPTARITTATNVDEALAFSEAEQVDLDAVVDGDEQLSRPAAYVLLCRAEGLPAEDELLEYAQVVKGIDLLASPASYRGGLIGLHIRIWRISRWDDPIATPTRGWGSRPVWRLDCTDRASGEPVIVLLTQLPERLTVGEQSTPVDDRALGLFYKVVRLPVERPAEANAEMKLYPVLVAKTLYGRKAPRSKVGQIILLVLLAALVVGYMLAKRSAKGVPAASGPRGGAPAATGQTDLPVDEDLVRAVEDHKRQNSEGPNA